MNEPSYLKYIGDKGVRTVTDAEQFIENVARKSYRDNGFGHYIVELRDSGTPIGTCGYVKRDELEYPDIGFAFLPQFCKQGYAFESARAVLSHGFDAFGLKNISAITTQNNENSGKLLAKLGLEFERLIEMPSGEKLKLFTIGL